MAWPFLGLLTICGDRFPIGVAEIKVGPAPDAAQLFHPAGQSSLPQIPSIHCACATLALLSNDSRSRARAQFFVNDVVGICKVTPCVLVLFERSLDRWREALLNEEPLISANRH